MNNIDNVEKIELEITSSCNAACPGCTRTQNLDMLVEKQFGLSDLKRIFPNEQYIKDKFFKFCGVLGDPIVNLECYDMVEYLATNGGTCQLSTNAAMKTAEWWTKLGNLSKLTDNVNINFCIDGHSETNHIYRVNTVWKVIERNIEAYCAAGGQGSWIYILFDHNEKDQTIAENHAKALGLKFALRTGMKNSYNNWISIIKKRDENKKLITQEKIITTTGEKQHSKVEKVKELHTFIENYKNESLDQKQLTNILNTMQCKYIHENEIYIAADLTMWPCCFLYDSYFRNQEEILDRLAEYGTTWNSLKHNSINEIMSHPWFKSILAESWDPRHNKHLARCIRTCAYNKAYQNELKFKD